MFLDINQILIAFSDIVKGNAKTITIMLQVLMTILGTTTNRRQDST